MTRFYISPEDVRNDRIYIKGKELRHIVKVLRLGVGDGIVAFDGKGTEYLGSIEKVSRSEVTVGIEKVRMPRSEGILRIALAQAIPRKGRMDYIVQKCTELGTSRIIPIYTARTVVKLDEKNLKRGRKRWQRLAIEASKQCGRVEVTEIDGLQSLKDTVSQIHSYDLALLPCLVGETRPLRDVLINYKEQRKGFGEQLQVLIFIGPEGDFTPQEVEEALEAGAIPVSLGENVLRCDTAAIATVAIVNYELGQMRPDSSIG